MKYSLSKDAFFEANTTIGNVDFSTEVLLNIMLNSASSTVSGSEGDIVCLDVDLGMPISCDEARYYFTSVSVSGTVVSGIEMFYKTESFENYSSFDVSIGSGYYVGTVSSGVLSPRYLRLLHTLSGTSVYGDINGFYIINNDDVVDFGTDGTMIDDTFSAVIDEPIIRTIPIYNSGNRTSTAYVTIEPQNTYVDDILYISNSENGSWLGVREAAYTIVDSDSWTNGTHYYTEIQNGRLVLAGEYTVGNYKTHMFEYEFSKYSYIDLDAQEPYTFPIVSVDEGDTIQTLEIRSSDSKPINYRVYRYVDTYRNGSTTSVWRARDYWVEDYTLAEDLGIFAQQGGSYQRSPSHTFLHTVVSPNRVMYVLDAYVYQYTGEYIRLWQADDEYETNDHSNDYDDIYLDSGSSWTGGETEVYNMFADDADGVWFYLYVQNGGTSQDITVGGYYLFHYSYGLTQDLKLFNTTDFIYDMDIVNDNNVQKLWYIDKTTGDLIKIDKDGNMEVSVSISTLLEGTATGITTADDGGCWIVAAPNVYKFDSEGELEETLSNVVSADGADKYIARDKGEDGLWVLEVGRLKRILLDGRIDFEYIQSTLVSIMDSSDSGVWLKNSSSNLYDFFDRSTRSIICSFGNATIDYRPGSIDYSFDNLLWGGRFPSVHDTVWGALDWHKIASAHYSLNEERYRQLRITLRADVADTADIVFFDFNDGLSSNWYQDEGTGTVDFSDNEIRITASHSGAIHPVYRISTDDTWEFSGKFKVATGYAGSSYCVFYPFYIDDSNNISVRMSFPQSHTHYIRVYSTYAGVTTLLFDSNYGGWSGSYYYRVKLRRVQYDMYFKVWQDGLQEPSSWELIDTFDTLDVVKEGYLRVYGQAPTDVNFPAKFDDIYLNTNFKYTSPGVDGVYIGRSIEVPDIPANNYRNVYLKTDIPQHNNNYLGSHSSNLRAWWDIPV